MTSQRVDEPNARIINFPQRPRRFSQEDKGTTFVPKDTFDGHVLTRKKSFAIEILANPRSDTFSRFRAKAIFDRKVGDAYKTIESHHTKKRRSSRAKLLRDLKFFMRGIDCPDMETRFDSLVLASHILGALMADPVNISDEAYAIATSATQILQNPELKTWYIATAISLQHVLPALDPETHEKASRNIFDTYAAEITMCETEENMLMLGAVRTLMQRVPNAVEYAYRPMLEKLLRAQHHGESDAVQNAAKIACSAVIARLPGGVIAAVMPALRAQFIPPIIRPV